MLNRACLFCPPPSLLVRLCTHLLSRLASILMVWPGQEEMTSNLGKNHNALAVSDACMAPKVTLAAFDSFWFHRKYLCQRVTQWKQEGTPFVESCCDMGMFWLHAELTALPHSRPNIDDKVGCHASNWRFLNRICSKGLEAGWTYLEIVPSSGARTRRQRETGGMNYTTVAGAGLHGLPRLRRTDASVRVQFEVCGAQQLNKNEKFCGIQSMFSRRSSPTMTCAWSQTCGCTFDIVQKSCISLQLCECWRRVSPIRCSKLIQTCPGNCWND